MCLQVVHFLLSSSLYRDFVPILVTTRGLCENLDDGHFLPHRCCAERNSSGGRRSDCAAAAICDLRMVAYTNANGSSPSVSPLDTTPLLSLDHTSLSPLLLTEHFSSSRTMTTHDLSRSNYPILSFLRMGRACNYVQPRQYRPPCARTGVFTWSFTASASATTKRRSTRAYGRWSGDDAVVRCCCEWSSSGNIRM